MARTRRPLIAGNWKMNGLRADGLALAKGVADGVKQAGWSDRDVLVCPPATLILSVADAVKGSGVLVGGENCHAKPSGAHTGEVAAEDIVETVAALEIAEEDAAAARIEAVIETVAEDEAIEDAFAADKVDGIVETVVEDEAAEEEAAAETIETIVETVNEDESAEEAAADETVETIAEKTMEENTKG